jgi:hypothetical protein
MRLDLETKQYPENSLGGLMICGINWGGNPLEHKQHDEQSFFSDASVQNYRFRNQLVAWFKLWGHALTTERGREGPFERSIFHTNWLPDQSQSTIGRPIDTELVRHDTQFFRHVEVLKPRMIILCSVRLMRALNQPRCLVKAERLLGSANPPQYETKEISHAGRRLKRFVFGFQIFEHCNVVAVPHPSGSRGLDSEYVHAFRKEIYPLLSDFRTRLSNPGYRD